MAKRDFLENAVGVTDLIPALTRETALDRIRLLLRRQTDVEALPGVQVYNDVWERLGDIVWGVDKKMAPQGRAIQPKYIWGEGTRKGAPSAITLNPEAIAAGQRIGWRGGEDVASVATHEVAHRLYGELLDGKQLSAWRKAVSKYGAHPYVQQNFEQGVLPQHTNYVMDTESMAYVLQDIFTPGREIQSPIGLIAEVEKLFDVRGLFDSIAHRLPVDTKLTPFMGPAESPFKLTKAKAKALMRGKR